MSKKGIEVDKAKIDLISNSVVSSSVKQVRSFLSYVGFYRRFIKDFSKVVCPLTNLLFKSIPFVFDESCVEACQKLRFLLATPIVQHPDFSVPFEIMFDAVGIVLG